VADESDRAHNELFRECQEKIAVHSARRFDFSQIAQISNVAVLASWLRINVTTAMKRFAALLIALTLTASPVAHAACLMWCSSAAEVSGTLCHHAVAGAVPVAMTAERTPCTAFIATNAFFTLERRATAHPPAAMVVPPERDAIQSASFPRPVAVTTASISYAAGSVRILRL
jgi:hypothetical protein